MIDADCRTLHIRCGSDIRDSLREGGFGGDFLEYSDPVCEGPVPDVPDLLPVRAEWLAAAYGSRLGMTEARCLAALRDAEVRLSEAHRYERVVLWFEHDSHDQLLLARILAHLAEQTLPNRLELICIDAHPSVVRFNGLGQLQAADLAALWPSRRPVTPDQIALGQAIWAALRQADPTALRDIAVTGTPALPVAARALLRHLRELPSVTNGLSLTQRIILDTVAEAPTPIGQIFAAMVGGREPLVFMGDLGFLNTVEAMARTEPSVLTIETGEKPFPRLVSITGTGRQVRTGTVDYLSLCTEDRWVGGVRIGRGLAGWRFDEQSGQVVQVR